MKLIAALLLCVPLVAAAQEYRIAVATAKGIDVDGRRLTNDSRALLTEGAWSPDGTKILFYAFRDGDDPNVPPFHFPLYVMDADGANAHRLLDVAVLPVARWSPDGARILYIASGALSIFQNGKSERIADGVSSASWSPDGSQIVFASREIFVTDGKSRQQLTSLGMNARNPVWSPDGQHIAFVAGGWFVMDANGANKKRVSRLAVSGVDWSPDSRRVLVLGQGGAYVYTFASGKSDAIGSGYGPIADAAFTPDGRRVVFRTRQKLYSANADGSDLRTIRDDGGTFAISPLRR